MIKTIFSDSPFSRHVLLDRDGVINVERGDYTTTIDQWRWAPGAIKGIRRLKEAGFGVIVITNQACIHKGIQTEEGLAALHRFMVDTIRESDGDITAVYHCPHWTPDNCDCRKPKPGMLLAAIDDYRLDASETFFIGDAGRDIEAGKRAGVKTIHIGGTPASNTGGDASAADFTAANLDDAVDIVLGNTKKRLILD